LLVFVILVGCGFDLGFGLCFGFAFALLLFGLSCPGLALLGLAWPGLAGLGFTSFPNVPNVGCLTLGCGFEAEDLRLGCREWGSGLGFGV
jgi:hypothetical protein|tara:strand:+ start:196 stop:465 length:270 start_codon:yes stop_codon:yes gene_type:complete